MTRPPRFLLGAALLFWGMMTERVVPGLACALLVEGAHWTRVRWDFGERAFLNAWRLSVLFLLVTMLLVLLNGARLTAMSIVFTWLPVVLMPLQFVQVYGMSSTTSLATFSMMVRRRRDHALRHGLPFREIRFDFGNVFLCATLLASCLGTRADVPVFYPLLVLLGAWGLIAASGRAWKQVGGAFLLAIVMSALLGVGGEMGLMKLYRYMTKMGQSDGGSGLEYARERRTSIGSLGTLKQSPEIVWRLIPEQGPLPKLLRVASYNTYLEQGWQADLLPLGTAADSDGFEGVPEINNPENPTDPDDNFFIAPPNLPDLKVAASRDLPRFRLRGATSSNNFSLLPLPANTASFHEFAPEEFDRNPFGTFRLKPAQPIADARVLWHPDFAPEQPPWKSGASSFDRRRFNFPHGPLPEDAKLRVTVEPELQIPPSEAPAIARVAEEVGLHEGPLEEKIARLRKHFAKNFTYTRYNRTREGFDPAKHGTLLGKFLTDTRAGHCEFFATSTALLLREAGVPTRYVTGFVAAEIDPKTGQAMLRGTHAHAWVRAWDADLKHWVDVDLTPPDWLGLEGPPRMGRFQGLTDWFQQKREDLLVWRDQPGHMMWITLALLTPLVLGMAFIGRNLWRSRSRLTEEKARLRGATVVSTPLTALERPARKLLGERPTGTPLAPWLRRLAPLLASPEALEKALGLHHQMRFDPGNADAGLAAELQNLVDGLRRELGTARRPGQPTS